MTKLTCFLQVTYFNIASMLTTPNSSFPKLQPPGMGLPKVELLVARILVGIKLRTTSQQEAAKLFVSESTKILTIADRVDRTQASRRILIKRLPGMEDSSRYWSLYMTMDHLCIVNRFTIDVINSLLKGELPQIVASTAAVKPREDVNHSVVPLFRSICAEFEASFPPNRDLKSEIKLAHPWFGELNAKQWHFFAGFHMNLHRKQMIKIEEQIQDE